MNDPLSTEDGFLLLRKSSRLLEVSSEEQTKQRWEPAVPYSLSFDTLTIEHRRKRTEPIHWGACAGTMKLYSQHKLIGRKK